MNLHLQQFISQVLRLVLPTLMAVFLVAFVCIPYSLGGHPGQARQDADASVVTAAAQSGTANAGA